MDGTATPPPSVDLGAARDADIPSEFFSTLGPVKPTWNDAPPPTARASGAPRDAEQAEVERRAIKCLSRVEAAIHGQNGSSNCMSAAHVVVFGFDLGVQRGFEILLEHYNPRCVPPWSEAELLKKCKDADAGSTKHRRGYLRDEPLPDRPDKPRGTRRHAREFATADGSTFGTSPASPATSQASPPPPASPAAPLDLSDLAGPAVGPPVEIPLPPISPSAPHTAPNAPPPTPPGPPSVRPTAPIPRPPVCVRNSYIVPAENGGTGTRVRMPLNEIVDSLRRVSDGWPKRVGPNLFAKPTPSRDPTAIPSPLWLESVSDLFAWINHSAEQTGGYVDWGKATDNVTKQEFMAHLSHNVEEKKDVTGIPHYPSVPEFEYLHPPLPSVARNANGESAFDRLLDMFEPATNADADLLRAFFLTLVWGGPPGKRPMFVFEASSDERKPGQGAGKTTIVETAGQLIGGSYPVEMRGDVTSDELMPQLLSKVVRQMRLVFFDNVKGSRVSSQVIESLITASSISGKQFYVASGSRPNYVTWALTSNQPSLSKDLAKRSIPIRINPATFDPSWNDRIAELVTVHRWEILAGMIEELKCDPIVDLLPGEWGRWAKWEQGVLCKVCDPRNHTAILQERVDSLDDDVHVAELVTNTIAAFIAETRGISNPHKIKMRMPAKAITEALKKISPHGDNITSTTRWLASIGLKTIYRKKLDSVRYWLWVGNDSDGVDESDWEVLD